ncbi:ATP-binding protein [Aliifodinibius sp. S!AR15-10]|uniref:sensor histidine kinase n=1 Tax=Aliifodinibius sp. S!AR15-10 TaxID=2950437 RepID=UPI0028703E36|nr:ATP-binding protein [Aliifodinibius sp. S!AR15-10]
MKTIRSIYLIIGMVFLSVVAEAQRIPEGKSPAMYSLPPVQNFTNDDYDSYIQNWDITQDSTGKILVANIGAVLEFDGVNWRSSTITNHRTLSIEQANDGRIYTGGIGELGYLTSSEEDSTITRSYHSLLSKIPKEYRDFQAVWNVIAAGQNVFFRTKAYLFQFKNDTIHVHHPAKEFNTAFRVNNKMYIDTETEGLKVWQGQRLKTILDKQMYSNERIFSVLPYKSDRLLIAFREKGLTVFDGTELQPIGGEVNRYLSDHKVYTGLSLPDGTYLFGTLNGGIVRVDKNGNFISILASENGLQNNQVHNLYLDDEQNVWAAFNNGLSKIDYLSPARQVSENSGLEETVFATYRAKGKLFAGTKSGLKVQDFQNNSREILTQRKFRTAQNVPDRCIDFSSAADSVLAICEGNLFSIKNHQVIELIGGGSMMIIEQSNLDEDIYYMGMREGVKVVRIENDQLTDLGRIPGIEFEPNTIVEDSLGALWLGTISHGLFKVENLELQQGNLNDAEVFHYPVPHNNSNQSLRAFNISGKMVLGTSSGLFTYDMQKDSLVRDSSYADFLAEKGRQVYYMEEGQEGNIWVRSNRENQLLIKEDDDYRLHVGGLERIDTEQLNEIYVDGKGLAWFATENGLIRYDLHKDLAFPASDISFDAMVREVLANGDSLINGGPPKKKYTLDYEDNELRFTYAATSFEAPEQNQYQVWLEGFDDGWSDWTSEVQKDYTNIPEDHYTFHVRARNVYGTVSSSDQFSFTVLPPWYRTIWAYLGYLLLAGGVLYGIHRFRVNQILKEQRIRNNIASNLHDEVSATLSSISYFTQAIRQTKDKAREQRFVNLIAESTSEAKEKITDIIWSIDPENDDWVNLLAKCRRFASDLLESKNMDYELDIDRDINRPLELEVRQHLWLIFKEMVTNAARHSGADKVEVKFSYQKRMLRLAVQDNGAGFNPKGVEEGNGVKNIRARAEKIGADIMLASEPGLGTRWEMRLDL